MDLLDFVNQRSDFVENIFEKIEIICFQMESSEKQSVVVVLDQIKYFEKVRNETLNAFSQVSLHFGEIRGLLMRVFMGKVENIFLILSTIVDFTEMSKLIHRLITISKINHSPDNLTVPFL
jgi:hypothetical protein